MSWKALSKLLRIGILNTKSPKNSLRSLAMTEFPGARDEVCRVMEGGRSAFEKRYRRIFLEQSHV